jgi:hypothetical protein
VQKRCPATFAAPHRSHALVSDTRLRLDGITRDVG